MPDRSRSSQVAHEHGSPIRRRVRNLNAASALFGVLAIAGFIATFESLDNVRTFINDAGPPAYGPTYTSGVLFWGTVLSLAASIIFFSRGFYIAGREQRRIAQLQYTVCGYPVGTSDVCTECGAALRGNTTTTRESKGLPPVSTGSSLRPATPASGVADPEAVSEPDT